MIYRVIAILFLASITILPALAIVLLALRFSLWILTLFIVEWAALSSFFKFIKSLDLNSLGGGPDDIMGAKENIVGVLSTPKKIKRF